MLPGATAAPILINYSDLPAHQEQRLVNLSHLPFWECSRMHGYLSTIADSDTTGETFRCCSRFAAARQ
jgi:hypothetical protein